MDIDFIGILFWTATLILAKVYDGTKNSRPVYEDNDTIYNIVQQLLAVFMIKLWLSNDGLCISYLYLFKKYIYFINIE